MPCLLLLQFAIRIFIVMCDNMNQRVANTKAKYCVLFMEIN